MAASRELEWPTFRHAPADDTAAAAAGAHRVATTQASASFKSDAIVASSIISTTSDATPTDSELGAGDSGAPRAPCGDVNDELQRLRLVVDTNADAAIMTTRAAVAAAGTTVAAAAKATVKGASSVAEGAASTAKGLSKVSQGRMGMYDGTLGDAMDVWHDAPAKDALSNLSGIGWAPRLVLFLSGLSRFDGRPILERVYAVLWFTVFASCCTVCFINLWERTVPYHNFVTDLLTAYVHLPVAQAYFLFRRKMHDARFLSVLQSINDAPCARRARMRRYANLVCRVSIFGSVAMTALVQRAYSFPTHAHLERLSHVIGYYDREWTYWHGGISTRPDRA